MCALASCSDCANSSQSSRYVAKWMPWHLSRAMAASVHRTNTREGQAEGKNAVVVTEPLESESQILSVWEINGNMEIHVFQIDGSEPIFLLY